MLISFSLRRFADQLAVALRQRRRHGRLRSRRGDACSPVAAEVNLLESRELLSSILVNSASGGQNYAADVTAVQLDPTQTAVTLRDAINAANNSTGADTISFDTGVFPTGSSAPATILLAGGTPLNLTDTSGATTITAAGAGQVAVSGNNLNTVFLINAGVTATIDGLTITGGKGSIDIGGGLKAGGGIYNSGALTLENTVLTANAAGNYGGGFYNTAAGTVTVTGSTITGNSGQVGAGFFNGGIATVTDTTITGNTATSNGGGIYNQATLVLNRSLLASNTAAVNGGGVFSNNTATFVNSTLTGNAAGSFGGGFINLKTATLIDSTIAANFAAQGGGVYNLLGTATLSGTIVARNAVSATIATPRDWAGIAAAAGSSYNLVGDGTATGLTNGANHNLVGTSANPLNPFLAPLGDYGGATQTLALLPGSLALAAGADFTNPATGLVIATDQRGVSRSQGTAPDIGAYQSAGFAFVVTSGDGQSAIVGQTFTDPLAVQLIEKGFGKVLGSAGVVVSFAAPSASVSANLSPGAVATNASGIASVIAQANGIPGGPYAVVASAAGVDSASFQLTNLPIPDPPPGIPTVDSLTTTETTPTIVGTWDSVHATVLEVTISNASTGEWTTFTLGVHPQLTAGDGAWTLNLAGTPPLAVGAYDVVVHTANGVGESADSDAGSLVIASTPPVLGELGPQSASVGVPVTIAAAVIGGDTTALAATIDWGDGTVTAGVIANSNGVLTVSGSHSYSASGAFDIVLTVTNDSDLSASATATASITGVSVSADLQVTGGKYVQIDATSTTANYTFDVAFVSGGVQLTGTNGTTFNGAATLFIANARSVSARLGDGDDCVRVTGKGQSVSLAMGGGRNTLVCKNFEGEKLQVSSEGALRMHAWNSTLGSLFVTGSTDGGDHFHAIGLCVTGTTQLLLGDGLNVVKINNSRFKTFQLRSSGSGTIVRIETGRSDGTGTRFDGTAQFLLGDDARVNISPRAKSDRTVFNGKLILIAGSADARLRLKNVQFAHRPILKNVDVV